MAPIIGTNGGTLLVRKLPAADPTYGFSLAKKKKMEREKKNSVALKQCYFSTLAAEKFRQFFLFQLFA